MGQDRLADLNFTAIANDTILAFCFSGASLARRAIGRNLQDVRRVQEVVCQGLKCCSRRERVRLCARCNTVNPLAIVPGKPKYRQRLNMQVRKRSADIVNFVLQHVDAKHAFFKIQRYEQLL